MSAVRHLGVLSLACALLLLPPGAGAADKEKPEDRSAAEEAVLKNAGLSSDGEALVKFFRTRSLTEADLNKLRDTIKLLGDDSFEVREKASADLVAAGRRAIPLLKEVVNHNDLEIARRAERALEQL